MSEDQRRAEFMVRVGLLGSFPSAEHLYYKSPEFHQGIDLLARVLPQFIELMAEDARKTEARRKVMEEALGHGVVRGLMAEMHGLVEEMTPKDP
jgi:hypothetical protein